MRQNVLKTEELSETSSRLGKPICAGRYRRLKLSKARLYREIGEEEGRSA